MLARGSIPFRLPDRQMPSQMLARIAGYRRGGRIRMADGGSLLANALNAVTAPDPTGSNPIQTRTVTPYPGNYNTYGFGPEWNWFDYLNGQGSTPPPSAGGPAPSGTPGGPGTGGAGDQTGGSQGLRGDSGAGGNKGPTGEGPAQAAADAAARNTAATPSLGKSLALGMAAMGPLGMMGALAKQALSSAGVLKTGPFDVAGPTLSPAQQAAIANSTATLSPNAPTVTVMNAINNAIQLARQQALSGQSSGGLGPAGAGPGSLGAGAWGGIGSDTPGGQARAAAQAMGRGSSGGNGGGGGAPSGGGGGLSGGGARGFKQGGPTMKGLGWLANGGRLHMAGGGSSSNAVLTSLVPIAAGLIGNIVSGPIGGAIASGAATAMTGGSLTDALSNVGSTSGDAIDQLLKYFPNLVNQQPADTANTSNSGYDPVAVAAMNALNKLTGRVPAANDTSVPGTSSGTAALYAGRGHLPGMAHGGELDARGGTHVSGEGDGQSDDIPAKLSDGEYVLDSALVSSIGSGSNQAGAKILDNFRQQVRKKSGYKNTKTIPPKINAAAMLGKIAHGARA
jgi:hypothetical protein